MHSSIRAKLSVMMFLEYVIYGSWLPLLGNYIGQDHLKFTDGQQGWVFNAFAIASITGMFFGGQLVDRYFAQEKFLAFSHLIGGVAMIGLMFPTTFWPFFGLMLLHCFFFVPTMSVTNSIAFANIEDAQKDFGFIRVWGTVGWVAVAWPFVFILIDWGNVPAMTEAGGFVAWLGKMLGTLKTGEAMQAALTSTFAVAGIASLFLAAFSLTLPHTPPPKSATSFAPAQAFKLLKIPAIFVLFVVTFIDSLVHYMYFYWTGRYFTLIGLPVNWVTPAMSIGQIAEILAMAGLGFFLKKLGWRLTMIFGLLGQVIRFGMYAIGTKDTLWLVIVCNVVHGFAYAFFFATVYIFADENFPKDVRTSAQSLFNLLILGLGPLASNFLSAALGKMLLPKVAEGSVPDPAALLSAYHKIFLVPFALGTLATLLLALFFYPKAKDPVPEEVPVMVN